MIPRASKQQERPLPRCQSNKYLDIQLMALCWATIVTIWMFSTGILLSVSVFASLRFFRMPDDLFKKVLRMMSHDKTAKLVSNIPSLGSVPRSAFRRNWQLLYFLPICSFLRLLSPRAVMLERLCLSEKLSADLLLFEIRSENGVAYHLNNQNVMTGLKT